MVLMAVTCPYCQSDHITKRGKTDTGKQRYRCLIPPAPTYRQELRTRFQIWQKLTTLALAA